MSALLDGDTRARPSAAARVPAGIAAFVDLPRRCYEAILIDDV